MTVQSEVRHLANVVSQVSLGFWIVVSVITFVWFSRSWAAGFVLGAVAGAAGMLYSAKSAAKVVSMSPSGAGRSAVMSYFVSYGFIALVLFLAAFWEPVNFLATAISLLSVRIVLIIVGLRDTLAGDHRGQASG